MAENKHTAGLWVHYDDSDRAVPRHTVMSSGKTIAYVYCTKGDEAADAANARLIAAAPDMLEALEQLLGNAEVARFHLTGTEDGMLVGSALFDTIQQARAAIARATQPGEV